MNNWFVFSEDLDCRSKVRCFENISEIRAERNFQSWESQTETSMYYTVYVLCVLEICTTRECARLHKIGVRLQVHHKNNLPIDKPPTNSANNSLGNPIHLLGWNSTRMMTPPRTHQAARRWYKSTNAQCTPQHLGMMKLLKYYWVGCGSSCCRAASRAEYFSENLAVFKM